LTIHVALRHVTHYRYDRLVGIGPQVVRLRPAPHSRTPILSYSLTVTPPNHFINWQQDPQGNYLARLVFPEPARELKIEVDLVAEMAVINPFDFFLEPEAEKIPFKYDPTLEYELEPYLRKLPPTPLFQKYLDAVPREPMPTIDYLVALNQGLQRDIGYLIRMEPGVQTPEETLTNASGSCRDSTWLLVQLLRHLGMAARFVSGYLIQLKADVKSLDGPSGTEVDFTDLHAWCEVYLPGAGWVGLDPTSGLFASEGHIPLAATPDPGNAAPITGMTEPAEVEFGHEMSVTRIFESPRVTLPYTDEQWKSIETLGARIEGDLKASDVRLTMGGEPTFVSVDDREGGEWNTDAVGPTKRGLSATLLAKLKARYAPTGLLHYGQGKWYPGEQLPRWSLSCFWRDDGDTIWSDPKLFADEKVNYGVTEVEAGRFLALLAQKLRLDPKYVFPAYEDTWYYLWRERRLPTNVDPLDSNLADPLERERLRKIFSQGLDTVAGYVLPVKRQPSGAWQTGEWFLRPERCYLTPGDSAIGLRLPLDSQPWASATDYPWTHAPDLTAPQTALPPHREISHVFQSPLDGPRAAHVAAERISSTQGVYPEGGGFSPGTGKTPAKTAAISSDTRPGPQQSAGWITRTAMCTEARNGVLYIFMPPMERLEDYLELTAAIEITAAEMKLPVVLEGYEPPRDARLKVLRVTPDPGVIEVNVQPVATWRELVDNTTFLYDAAHELRLTTEKFMVDGRHTGTGGGNHFVLGGVSVVDSPFLRRPDLLKSLIAFWHNHPSLSFMFSGMFIGPTSQAPRLDEARNDSVYEIEVAFGEIERLMKSGPNACPPWIVDRVLRNLLIDSSGNTHRTEFCIDKLYSPDSSTGRLGLLELRAFEMPPHARMSLTQQLLLRALVARFWRAPYKPNKLVRWGTELHDRFMLPYFVWRDFEDVIAELNHDGYPFKAEWFASHFEFRFPRYGEFAAYGAQFELRAALEPWHVLGEEGSPAGTVRYVDSTLERLQVKATGMINNRHVLTCNGRAMPLTPTGRVGEYVAGVRYRAWAAPSSLHPTIPVHAPLIFDLVDTWMNRSMGGAQYHVAHPGGRAHEDFPVNAYAAEGRRLARFVAMGHTPGEIRVKPEERNPNFPFTLDLRLP
jgi:uncharacterized protein (DUF2126 family)